MLPGRLELEQSALRSGSPRLWLPLRADKCTGVRRTAPESPGPWFRPLRFDYRISGHDLAILSLLADVERASPPSWPSLLVRRAEARSSYAASAGETWSGRALLWQVTFEVPLDVVEYPRALFSLGAPDRIVLALPTPRHRFGVSDLVVGSRGRLLRPLARRSAVALVASLAFAAVPSSCVGVATAASAPTQPAQSGSSGAAPQTTGSGSGAAGGRPQSASGSSPACSSPPVGTTTPTPMTTSQTAMGAPGQSPAGAVTTSCSGTAAGNASTTGTPTKTPTTGSKSGASNQTGTTKASPKAHEPGTGTVFRKKVHRHAPGKPAPSTRRPSGGAGLAPRPRPALHRRERRKKSSASVKRRLPPRGAAPAIPVQSTPWTAGFGIDAATAAEIARFSTVSASLDQPPAFLIPFYKAAGRKYDIPWQILAAINAIETDYGQDLAISPKGAVGWMQFMPATWIEYGVDVSGHGTPNPYDPRDAIFSAARLLAANGGAREIRRALFAYNDALWYVDAVLWRAALISDRGLHAHLGRHGYALPLDAHYMTELGRTDDGVDIEDAPDGAAVYSITPGVVTAVASDPSGFGPDYPVILVTAGPLAGQYIYYGHVAASLVKVGQHVVAGQPVAVMGHTGDAASLGHGHIEIGFSDGAGDPLNHHGAPAATPSGAAMRTVLVALSSAFGIKNS